jgi:hypothetical protein
MVVAAALTGILLLVLLPLSVLRVTRVAARHRGPAARGLAAVASLWLVMAVLNVQTGGGAVAANTTAPYVYGQISRVPGELEDQREFEQAADAEEDAPEAEARGLLSGLRGKNVLFVFVESYGKVALDGSWFSPGVNTVVARASQQLKKAGFGSRSAWFTSPTFGGISWLAHATFQSGLWVDSQQRYDILMKSPRMTLSKFFGNAGWRPVAVAPSNNRDWPEGRRFYRFDKVYDSRNIGYKGPRFGYPTMPDQFTLAAFQRLELAPDRRRPVMAEIDLLSSHTPWSRTPRMVKESTVGDGRVFWPMKAQLPSEEEIWTSAKSVQEAYGHSIEYSLTALTHFIRTYLDDDDVVVFMGDHQPSTIVSGENASHETPVTIVARDRHVLEQVAPWGWDRGLRPTAAAPVWRMDQFRDRFLAAFGGRARKPAQSVSAQRAQAQHVASTR